ncbi:hypothetical protein FQN55_004294 [Onygenales sp. PD_40]|nr:hypothetical protein FQN55_004294 [Onygenales sp. PD_40]KAK2768879.1 hypothetical protein FQN53_006266 [Emmonsiellopsis sp. PD_33]KAK2794318.1 hypothetical protein FQN52_008676 [Onygenales sp. PD_12]KAK2801741.1 hypothetical protein FQN51_005106 [Onygenales sp. PD_10]
MSFFALSRSRLPYLPASASALRVSAPRLSAGFHQSSNRGTLKESDRHREDLEEIVKKKDEYNRQLKEGNVKWHESLASDSEADVKADRGEVPPEEAEKMEKTVKTGGRQPPSATGKVRT